MASEQSSSFSGAPSNRSRGRLPNHSRTKSIVVALSLRDLYRTNETIKTEYLADVKKVKQNVHLTEFSSGLKYRQILRGNNFLQLIYDSNNKLNDCEFVQDENISKTFLINFKQDLSQLLATSNISIHTLRNNFLPQDIKSWLDMRKMRRECKTLHRRLKTEAENIKYLDISNSTRRERRDIGDFLRVPGTKWCGKGFSADKYTRLGMFSRTDRCCRKHDTSCPFWIGGFSTKYGLYNWRINTIMHCGCDERSV
ncbi:hypothetical protein WA026_000263 [Henosepilachna vigintioctopunctata]|uniref:phospholipase A2 n=1 Tax=Henosepilachna vigintioctopunctata TaxID=420089 RepID=A0AAW1V6P1_9CUCU